MKFYKETHFADEIKGTLMWPRTQHYEAHFLRRGGSVGILTPCKQSEGHCIISSQHIFFHNSIFPQHLMIK